MLQLKPDKLSELQRLLLPKKSAVLHEQPQGAGSAERIKA